MNAGPSGFHNAPVTKGFIILCGVASVFAATQGRASSLGLSYQAIAKKFHLWKLVTSIFVFSSTSELLFGLTLLYYFRVFERQIGSNKYSVQILFTAVFSTVLELIILLLFKDWFPDGLASGPYSVIVSLFVPFFLDIPVSSRFHLFNVRLSDKSFIYLAGIQLLLSSWKRSFVPGICGVIAGICYRMNICGIQKLKLPKVVTSTCSRLFAPFISSGPSNAPPRRSVARETINAPLGQQFQGHRAQPSSAPSEEAIAMLVSMGFDRASSVQALVQTRNDVNAAADLLLSRQ